MKLMAFLICLTVLAAGCGSSKDRRQGFDPSVQSNVEPRPPRAAQAEEPAQVVEEMRGFAMQLCAGGKPTLSHKRSEEIIKKFRRIGNKAVPELARALKDPDVEMRRNAALVLIFLPMWLPIQPPIDTRAAMPALIEAMKDADHRVRAWAAHALGEIGPDAERAVPALIKMLKDPEEGPRNCSAIALGRIGPAARPAIPALQEALNDPKKDVRFFALKAIKRIQKSD